MQQTVSFIEEITISHLFTSNHNVSLKNKSKVDHEQNTTSFGLKTPRCPAKTLRMRRRYSALSRRRSHQLQVRRRPLQL